MCDAQHLFIIWGKYKNVLGEAAFLLHIIIFIYRNERKIISLKSAMWLLLVYFLGGGGVSGIFFVHFNL